MKLSVFQTIVTAWFLVFLSGPVLAQQQIKPGRNVVRLTWIQPGAYKMIWYAERDTLVIRIGEVIINTLLDKNRLTITTEVLMSGGNDAWIDTTHAHTLRKQRDAFIIWKSRVGLLLLQINREETDCG
jgi:hypothetical protein